MRWYYFIRSGSKLLPRKEGRSVPPRPADANPDNGDPLTPWYLTEDHADHCHAHVHASSEEEAYLKARALVEAEHDRRRTGSHPRPHGGQLLQVAHPDGAVRPPEAAR